MSSNPLKDAMAASGETNFLTPATAQPRVAEQLAKQFEAEEEEQPAGSGGKGGGEEEAGQQQAAGNEAGNEEETGTGTEKEKGADKDVDEIDLSEIKTFADLQEALGLDKEDALVGLTVDLGDDDTPNNQSLAQLVESYTENRSRKETYDQQEARRNQEHIGQIQKLNQKIESDLIQVGNFVETSIEFIAQALSSPEMKTLRQTNPAEWAAKDQEMRTTIAGLQQGYQAAHDKAMAEIETHRQAFRAQESQKIKAKYPDWTEKGRFEAQGTLMKKFGFSQAEINQYSQDSRITFAMQELIETRAALKALKAEKAKGAAAATRVKTEKPPLLRKRGPDGRFVSEEDATSTTRGRQTISRKGLRQAMTRLVKKGDTTSAVEAVKRQLSLVQ